jgi:hypothetical protein
MFGAKATSLPAIGAGLIAATVICSLVDRRLHRHAALLSGLAVVAFGISYKIFFADGAGGVRFRPLGLLSWRYGTYPGLFDGAEMMSLSTSLIAAVSLTGMLALGAGLLALLTRGGWRHPDTVFLVVACASGLGAGLTFYATQGGGGTYYFVYVILLPLSLGAVLGLFHVGSRLSGISRRILVAGGLTIFTAGAGAAYVLGALVDPRDPAQPAATPMSEAISIFLIPAAATLAITLTLTAAFTVGFGRFADRRVLLVLPIAVLVFAGLGSVRSVQGLPELLTDPIPAQRPEPEVIGEGGLEAARWLRAHTATNDLVATNAHCRSPRGSQISCDARNFWIAAYAERRVLVEGWSFIWRSSAPDADIVVGPFWDAAKQRANDSAFHRPTERSVQRLKEKYGVQWLFVDRRFPADAARLKAVSRVTYERGDYIVLSL